MPHDLEALLKDSLCYLHRHPETAFEETLTTAHLRAVLEENGVTVLDTSLRTGLIAQVTGAHPGRTIGLRADIDALPVLEDSELDYASLIPGKMHACGHDFHACTMLGAALLLKERQNDLHGTVKIVFQPAEETDSGGAIVAPLPQLRDCECFLAGHTYPAFPAGVIGVKEGAVMAAVDRFKVIIHGRGTHAAHPHAGIDPVVVQAALVQSLQTIVSRTMSPFSHSLVSITHVSAGNTWNVIPQEALLEGTIRTLDADDRIRVEKQFRQIVAGVTAAYGATADINWTHGSPAVINDPALCDLARRVAARQGLTVREQEDTLGGEDFSEYLTDRPGLFVRIGTGGDYPAHHPAFTVDPAALYPAACFFADLASACLAAE